MSFAIRPASPAFVGSGNHPIPLSPKEAEDIMSKLTQEAKPKVEIKLEVGDMVEVKSGPFAGQAGPVVAIDADKAKVKFRVTVFGRETDVEADYIELEKI
jgi:transcriptional antiterminator NusG